MECVWEASCAVQFFYRLIPGVRGGWNPIMGMPPDFLSVVSPALFMRSTGIWLGARIECLYRWQCHFVNSVPAL